MIIFPILLTIVVRFWPKGDEPAAMSGVSRLVVVPAKVFGTAEPSYLGDAVARTLTAYLEQLPGLDTRPSPSSFDFEKAGGDYAEAKKAYAVDALVLTAITIDAGLYMLNVQVVDPDLQTVLWTNRYLGPREQYLELVREAGEGLRRALRPRSAEFSFAGGVSSNAEAELSFREGEYYRDRRQPDAARVAFERALALDPALADAAAEIAFLDKANGRSWAERALALDPRCGRAYIALALIETDLKRSLENALRGAAFAPRYPLAHKVLGRTIKPAEEEWHRMAPFDKSRLPEDTSPMDDAQALQIIDEARSKGEVPDYLK
jgi:tetratricopeptide (TPR) repeat protein